MKITVVSFSYKYSEMPSIQNPAIESLFIFDCRAILNPGRVPEIKHLTGKDPEIIDYLYSQSKILDWYNPVYSMLEQHIAVMIEKKFDHTVIGFGCTGGLHRSVFCAEKTKNDLEKVFPLCEYSLEHFVLDKKS